MPQKTFIISFLVTRKRKRKEIFMTMSKKAIFLTNHTEDWLRASSRWSPTTSSTSKRFLRSYVLLVSLSFRRSLNERSNCSTARPILRWHSSLMCSAFNSKNNWLPIWTNWSDPFISICVILVLASFSIISPNPYSLLFFFYFLLVCGQWLPRCGNQWWSHSSQSPSGTPSSSSLTLKIAERDFPLCMRSMTQYLIRHSHLKNDGRLQLIRFLKVLSPLYFLL